MLAYVEALYWLVLPLFLAFWCALAWSGRGVHGSREFVRVRVRQTVRRYDV